MQGIAHCYTERAQRSTKRGVSLKINVLLINEITHRIALILFKLYLKKLNAIFYIKCCFLAAIA